MSNFPNNYDSDAEIPAINDNLDEIGGTSINGLRDAVFNIEQNIGLSAQGSTSNIAARLNASLNADGSIKTSAIASMGLVTLPITNSQISNSAAITENKLSLDHSTQNLYNSILAIESDIDTNTSWISTIGIKLTPHINGADYRHTLSQLEVANSSINFFKNKFGTFRNNNDVYLLINDINNDLIDHQKDDGYIIGSVQNIITNSGDSYPSNYAHTSAGIFLDTSRFSTVPQTAQDLQTFAEFIDNSNIFLYGTRIQNLYSNGISRVSRSSAINLDGYGINIIPITNVITYLLDDGTTSAPFDNIDSGDDIIEFLPSSSDRLSFSFDEKFSQVKIGDIIRVNYINVEVEFIIKEKKYQPDINPLFTRYLIRIAGRNLAYVPIGATARIDRSLVNDNKFGVVSVSASNSPVTDIMSSLIVASPRGAQALGLGFKPNQIDNSHYLLYIALYPTGFPNDGYTILPGIDISGNQGATPGKYTLDSIIESTNASFRKNGYNYRFTAFSYNGNFGIMLADSYNNAGFSIINGIVDDNGNFNESATNINFPNNVIDLFEVSGKIPQDPLGFGEGGSNLASPPYLLNYSSSVAAIKFTKIFLPLKRNNYYVNGVEKDKLNIDIDQFLDNHGDGYWIATLDGYTAIPGSPGRVQAVYRIDADLDDSNLQIGKTLVVQSLGMGGSFIDFGRFMIEDLTFNCPPDNHTNITIYDAVHANTISPANILPIGSKVAIYFGSDSVSFNKENLSDFSSVTGFKRHFEIYTESNGNTFTHERARFYNAGTSILINGQTLNSNNPLNNFDIVSVSPKLQGYVFGNIKKISLQIISYDNVTGEIIGNLTNTSATGHEGQLSRGKIGEIIRFYDESNIDYIDFILKIDTSITSFSNKILDIQLFPSLILDDQLMIIYTCQYNDVDNIISQIVDTREFGNTSQKDLSTSAINFISSGDRLLHSNGVLSGFDFIGGIKINQIPIYGGSALVNGKVVQINSGTVDIPPIQENNNGIIPINWAVCVSEGGEIKTIPLLDKFNSFNNYDEDNRVFIAYNIVNSSSYIIDSVSFNELVNFRKDLTILYIVNATVTAGPHYVLAISDARRFIKNETSNIQLTWVPDDGKISGNFHSIEALTNWINFYGSTSNTIKIKGTFTINDTIDFTNIHNSAHFIGDNAIFNIYSSSGLFVKEGITLENIIFNYNPSLFNLSGNINADSGCILGDTDFTGIIKDISVNNCIFNSELSAHPPFICFRVGVDNDGYLGYADGITIINNKFNDTTINAASIAIINTYEGSFTTFTPTIANILIENNICNKNQSFYFVSTFSSFDSPGLAAINVKIINNRLGYICYNISGTYLYNSNVRGSNHLFMIEKNSLIAVIGGIDQTGNFNVVATSITHPTGNVVIADNDVNFLSKIISTDGHGGNGFIGKTTIFNNRLVANDPAILSAFSISNVSTAIEVIHNASTTNQEKHSLVIFDNIILPGSSYTTEYLYQSGIYSNTSCSIYNNTIILSQSGGNGIFVNAGLSYQTIRYDIHHNNIYRGNNNIESYIFIGPSTHGIINNNYFDSSYIDVGNTDKNVIVGYLGSIPNSYKNINQIYSSFVRAGRSGNVVGGGSTNTSIVLNQFGVSNSVTTYDSCAVSFGFRNGVSDNLLLSSMYLTVGPQRRIVWLVQLNEIVPPDAIIVSATIQAQSATTDADGQKTAKLIIYSEDATSDDIEIGSQTQAVNFSLTPTTLTVAPVGSFNANNLYAMIIASNTHASVSGFLNFSALTIEYKFVNQ